MNDDKELTDGEEVKGTPKRDRLEIYWRVKGFPHQTAFADFLELHSSHIGEVDKRTGLGKLGEAIAIKCPDLNQNWVLTGEGDMIISRGKETPHKNELMRLIMEKYVDKFSLVEGDAKQDKFLGKMLELLPEFDPDKL